MSSDDEYVTSNKSERNLTYKPWHEHLKSFFISQWKVLSIYFFALFGIFSGIVQTASFFYPEYKLNSSYYLIAILIICATSSIVRCSYRYKNTIPEGLENENKKAQEIAFYQKPFWEYKLAHELLNHRINQIDRNLEDILNNRVHIKVVRTLGILEYVDWIQTRPENLLRLVDVSKQLLISDLVEAIHADENNNVDFKKLVRTADLIRDAYSSAYEYEIEGREIKIPKEFQVIHEIQSGWASVIRDGVRQMLTILNSVANRKRGDFSPLEGRIVFEAPPRIDEFSGELEKISKLMEAGVYL